jgi:hypothetical protein
VGEIVDGPMQFAASSLVHDSSFYGMWKGVLRFEWPVNSLGAGAVSTLYCKVMTAILRRVTRDQSNTCLYERSPVFGVPVSNSSLRRLSA